MADVKDRRRYASRLREEQARETRQRILDIAARMFEAQGFVATTIGAIARESEVASQTVYAVFGTKRGILAELLSESIGGDRQPIGVLERSGPQRMREEPDQRRQLAMMANGIAEILERAGPVFTVVRAAAAADPEIAKLHAGIQEERLRNMTTVVGWVAAHGPLKAGLTVPDAADVTWTLTSADVHRLITVERGWSRRRYERWLSDALIAALLP